MLRKGWNRFKGTMQPVLKVTKTILQMLDGFLIILTPLIIILIVVLIIVLPSNNGAYWRELQKMEREGEVVWGKMIDSYDPDEEETYLGVVYPTYYDEDEVGLLRIGYYSREQLLPLEKGAPVQIRHLPNELETTVMLEQYFDPLRNLWQINQDYVIILAVCWLIIAWHPEMLYLGYQNPFESIDKGDK